MFSWCFDPVYFWKQRASRTSVETKMVANNTQIVMNAFSPENFPWRMTVERRQACCRLPSAPSTPSGGCSLTHREAAGSTADSLGLQLTYTLDSPVLKVTYIWHTGQKMSWADSKNRRCPGITAGDREDKLTWKLTCGAEHLYRWHSTSHCTVALPYTRPMGQLIPEDDTLE
jgi:hypothetical protein